MLLDLGGLQLDSVFRAALEGDLRLDFGGLWLDFGDLELDFVFGAGLG